MFSSENNGGIKVCGKGMRSIFDDLGELRAKFEWIESDFERISADFEKIESKLVFKSQKDNTITWKTVDS